MTGMFSNSTWIGAALAWSSPAPAGTPNRWQPVAPLQDPALLNTGFVCHWDRSCITKQQRAMRSSLRYVNSHRVPAWKIQICNHAASRNGTRKDWIGFNGCIRFKPRP